MPRIKKPKYLTYKNELPVRMPEIGEVVSIHYDTDDLYLEGKVIEIDGKEGFLIGSEKGMVGWWWHINTFGRSGSNHDKFLKIRRYYET